MFQRDYYIGIVPFEFLGIKQTIEYEPEENKKVKRIYYENNTVEEFDEIGRKIYYKKADGEETRWYYHSSGCLTHYTVKIGGVITIYNRYNEIIHTSKYFK